MCVKLSVPGVALSVREAERSVRRLECAWSWAFHARPRQQCLQLTAIHSCSLTDFCRCVFMNDGNLLCMLAEIVTICCVYHRYFLLVSAFFFSFNFMLSFHVTLISLSSVAPAWETLHWCCVHLRVTLVNCSYVWPWNHLIHWEFSGVRIQLLFLRWLISCLSTSYGNNFFFPSKYSWAG